MDKSLRQDERRIFDRLKSIQEDSVFVDKLSKVFSAYPVVANERCGPWYVDPAKGYHETVYFMSKDGHTNNWSFSLKRLNWHLLDIIANHKGCLLVDSTRKGKKIPDSFSKTVPIWCATINKALQAVREDTIPWDTEVHVPPSMVSNQEKFHIEGRIAKFVKNLQDTGIDLKEAARKINKPLRPLWFTPDSLVPQDPRLRPGDYSDSPFFPVICVSASIFVLNSDMERREGYTYVQGSGDDHETWSLGLTPRLFWQHQEELLGGDRDECERLVADLVGANQPPLSGCGLPEGAVLSVSKIGATNIFVGNIASGYPPKCWELVDMILNCSDISIPSPERPLTAPADAVSEGAGEGSQRILSLGIFTGKKGRFQLLTNIRRGEEFVHRGLREGKRVLICCENGLDVSVVLCIAVLCKYVDDEGNFHENERPAHDINKALVRRRLHYVLKSRPMSSPLRSLMRILNSHLMGQDAGQNGHQKASDDEEQ